MKNKKVEIIIGVILLFIALVFVCRSFNPNIEPKYMMIIWGIAILVGILFALRELNTWYWKINKAIELLEKIEKNTRKNNNG